MMSFAALVCGLIVSPSVRSGKLAQPPLSARMCSPQSTGAREPSLLTEISTILEDRCGGMFLEEIRGEMVDAFVLVSGEPAPAAGNFGDKPMPKAEIGLEQLSSTLRGPSLATRARRRGLPEAHHWPWVALHSAGASQSCSASSSAGMLPQDRAKG